MEQGTIRDFKIPHKIKIGSWTPVSAVYEGSVNSGFFSLKIEDCKGQCQWFGDPKSVEGKFLDSGEYVETGKLNFTNDGYASEWKFRPDPPLKPGIGKAILGIFEDKDYIDKNGKTISHRPHLDLQEKEIILY